MEKWIQALIWVLCVSFAYPAQAFPVPVVGSKAAVEIAAIESKEACEVTYAAPSKLIRDFESVTFKYRRKTGKKFEVIDVRVLTPAAKEALLLEMEKEVLARTTDAGLSAEEAREFQGFLNSEGSKWVESHFDIFFEINVGVREMTDAFLRETVVAHSKVIGLPWAQKMVNVFKFMSPLHYPRYAHVILSKIGRSVLKEMPLVLIMSTAGAIITGLISTPQGPIIQFSQVWGAYLGGPLATSQQTFLSKYSPANVFVSSLKQQRSSIDQYHFEKMTPEQARKTWKMYEQHFQEISVRMSQTLPATQRDGRGNFINWAVEKPIMLSAALSNHETQFSFHKKAREELLEKVAGRPPTSGEKEQLQYHADMMEVAESGIASVLAASRIMAFVYPEFARLYANDPATGQLNNAYNRFMAGNRIDLYVHHFRKQLDKTLVLLEAGISAKDIQ